MKKSMTMMLLLLVAMFCNAQMQDPVKFTAQLKTGNTAEGEIVFSGKFRRDGMSIPLISAAMVLSRHRSM